MNEVSDFATDAQRSYASSLGIEFPDDIGKWTISRLISLRKGDSWDDFVEKGEVEEVVARGLRLTWPIYRSAFDEKVSRFSDAEAWVFSVFRRESCARWTHFRESGLSRQRVIYAVALLLANDKVFETVRSQSRLTSSVEENDRHVGADPWFYFGEGGASTRIKAYKFVRDLLAGSLSEDDREFWEYRAKEEGLLPT